MSYANSMDNLEQAIKRLKRFIEGLGKLGRDSIASFLVCSLGSLRQDQINGLFLANPLCQLRYEAWITAEFHKTT